MDKKFLGFVNEVHKKLRVSVLYRTERSEEEWSCVFPRYPKSEDGHFCRCYEPTDTEGIRAAMARYGMFVVGIMTEEQAEETVRAMLEEVNWLRKNVGVIGPNITPTDPTTWNDENWPSKRKFLLAELALHPIAFRNRCLENVHQEVFPALYGQDRLHSTVDNWGICRGGGASPKWKK